MNAYTAVRQDGMMSVLSRVANERQMYGMSNVNAYNADVIYACDGLAQSIVDKPAEDCMSVGFTVEGDPNNDILNELDRLDAIPVITDCIRWSRLHGGGAILVFLDDGLPLTEPVNYDRINKVEDLIDYPASAMWTVSAERYNDPTKKNYGWPSLYEIKPKFGINFFVHESRLILVPGEPLPPSVLSNQLLPWIGRSALEACYPDIMRYKDGLRLAKGILERKVQLVHKMSNLGEMLASGQDEIVAKRLNIADSVRGIFNMLAIDALDDVVLADTQLAGIADIDDMYRTAICSSSRIAKAILFGEQPKGLNANAEGEKSIYHSLLLGLRNRRLRPILEQLARFIWAQKTLGASEPSRWQVILDPLVSPTADETATVKLKEAQAQKTAMEAIQVGMESFVMLPEEGRAALAKAYPGLDIDVTELPAIPDDPNLTGGATSDMSAAGQGSGTPASTLSVPRTVPTGA